MQTMESCRFGIGIAFTKDLRLRDLCQNATLPDKSGEESDLLGRPIRVCQVETIEGQKSCSGCQIKTFRVPDLNRAWL